MPIVSRFETCSCCGKKYLQVPFSIYKIKYNKTTYDFCSYTCYRKIQQLKEDRKYKEMEALLTHYDTEAVYSTTVKEFEDTDEGDLQT